MIFSKPDRLLSWRKGKDALHCISVFHGEKIGLAVTSPAAPGFNGHILLHQGRL